MSQTYERTIDFFGSGSIPVAADNAGQPFVFLADTGSPTGTYVDGSPRGAVAIALAATNEAEIANLYNADNLNLDIDNLKDIEFHCRLSVALGGSAECAFGLAGDRNDTLDSVAQHAWFRLIGSSAVLLETDDGTTDVDDVATGITLATTYKRFVISFAEGKSKVRFYGDDGNGNLAALGGRTFDMSAYAGSLQLYVQIAKTSSTNVGTIEIDRVTIRFRED